MYLMPLHVCNWGASLSQSVSHSRTVLGIALKAPLPNNRSQSQVKILTSMTPLMHLVVSVLVVAVIPIRLAYCLDISLAVDPGMGNQTLKAL